MHKALTSISSLNLNKAKVHRRFKNYNKMSTNNKLIFCKTCCKICHRICPRALAKYKAQSKIRREYGRSDNFIFISAKYIQQLYHYTYKYLLKRLLADDFLKSVVASIALFTIGIKLTWELNACSLTRIVH